VFRFGPVRLWRSERNKLPRGVAGAPGQDAALVVKVQRQGWSGAEAKRWRALPSTKKFCECAGAEACVGEPTQPTATSTLGYRLSNGQHDANLDAWNLTMRGY
jgi:hypothetical protein